MTALMRDPHVGYGRFRVLPRTDGRFIVFDPTRPFGDQTVGEYATMAQATLECERVSAEASARGEANEPERKGFKSDWGDSKTWEAAANVPARPLFPSLLEHDSKDGHHHGQEERNERHESGDLAGDRCLELELVDELPAAGVRRRGARPARRGQTRAGAQ